MVTTKQLLKRKPIDFTYKSMRASSTSNCLSGYHHGINNYPLVDNTTKMTSALVWHQKHSKFIFKHFWKGTKHFLLYLANRHYTPIGSKQYATLF
jgi:hypothetical protein